MKETEQSLDPQLWHACAGAMVQMPPVNSKVFYFPQGHAEHASAAVGFSAAPPIPPLVPCRVAAVNYLADPDTDEVYSKIKLIPIPTNDVDSDDQSDVAFVKPENSEKTASFAKTLTQSDANNGGGFSVPRYCAETIFPKLDYAANPPVQTVAVRDVHGEVWKFRHIYRGTPRRHLLTTGWSNFVNQKKLVAGDLIVFLRTQNGELCVGIRRARRGVAGGGAGTPSGWTTSGNPNSVSYLGFSVFLREEEEKKPMRSLSCNSGKVSPGSVVEAVALAANGRPFEVVYYPRASTPEFIVKAADVRAAIGVRWSSGMRFKMAFETEDSSRISWFMGTVASVQVADRVRWPNSPWRLLQVTWDEQDLLQNVKRVSPWLVELVSNAAFINLSPFSQSRKKLRLPPRPDYFHFDCPFPPIPLFSGNPSSCCRASDNAPPACIQGARQSTLLATSLSDHKKLQFGAPKITNFNEIVSCSLTMGSTDRNSEKFDHDHSSKKRQFWLFGQPILTEQQISLSSSRNGCDFKNTGQCKVFMESEDLGRTLDLSVLGSYEELYRRLTGMFGLGKSEMLSQVLYRDDNGTVRQAGEEPFSDFVKSAKRLTVLTDSGTNKIGRTWITGMRNADNGLDSSSKRCPLSIFA